MSAGLNNLELRTELTTFISDLVGNLISQTSAMSGVASLVDLVADTGTEICGAFSNRIEVVIENMGTTNVLIHYGKADEVLSDNYTFTLAPTERAIVDNYKGRISALSLGVGLQLMVTRTMP